MITASTVTPQFGGAGSAESGEERYLAGSDVVVGLVASAGAEVTPKTPSVIKNPSNLKAPCSAMRRNSFSLLLNPYVTREGYFLFVSMLFIRHTRVHDLLLLRS